MRPPAAERHARTFIQPVASTAGGGGPTSANFPYFRLSELRIERRRPQRHVSAITQCHSHLSGRPVDPDVAEKLHAGGWRQVLLVQPRRFDELHLGSEGIVEFVWTKGAGMEGPRNELPEWLKILKLRLVGVIVVSSSVMHVGRQPNRIGDTRGLDKTQKVRDFEFAPARGPVTLGKRFRTFLVGSVIIDNNAERHVGRDHLPGGA